MSKSANETQAPLLHVGESDLSTYAEGGLPPARRRAIEGFLAANPDLAAQVMTQMHLGHGRRPRRRGTGFLAAALGVGVAACVLSAVGGWAVAERRDLGGWREADGGAPPDYVEDSADSRQATRVRDEMVSQTETPRLDPPEIRRALLLALPRLPAGWRVRDVQVFPTDDGPSLNLVVDTARGRVELFAIRARATAQTRPELARRGRETVAFWERGEAAYVLSGSESPGELLSDAMSLAHGANL